MTRLAWFAATAAILTAPATWAQEGYELTPTGSRCAPAQTCSFFSTVSASDGRVLYGEFVFEPQQDGTWAPAAQLDAPSTILDTDLQGGRALIGFPRVGVDAGYANVYERGSGGSWALVATLRPTDSATGDGFGTTVSLSGDRALVGAPGDDEVGGAGAAYVFERRSDGSWPQVAKLTPSSTTPPAISGSFGGGGVALDGDRALVGWANRSTNDFLLATGVPHLFERQADGSWLLTAKLAVGGVAEDAQLGLRVALDGDRALVGAYPARLGANEQAYAFERGSDGSWPFAGALPVGPPATTAVLSVALDGDRALVGASDVAARTGAAHLLQRQTDGSWVEVTAYSREGTGLRFAWDVALDGEVSVAGSWVSSFTSPNRAFVFGSPGATPVEREPVRLPFTLRQNHPNPFAAATTIPFSLSRPGAVRLSVYDLLGREVRVLVDGARPAGPHEVAFGASDLPSGIYLYRLETAAATEVRRMALVR